MLFEEVFQVKLVLFQGGRLMTTVRFVRVEDFSTSEGDLFFLMELYIFYTVELERYFSTNFMNLSVI